jgi:hypothetical protein
MQPIQNEVIWAGGVLHGRVAVLPVLNGVFRGISLHVQQAVLVRVRGTTYTGVPCADNK